MNLRIFCSLAIVVMFAGMVQAQQWQAPSPKDSGKSDSGKTQPQEVTVEVSTPSKSSGVIPYETFSPVAELYRPLAWLSADYTLSWISRPTVPALVTGSPNGIAQADAGVLGRSTTNVLLGNGAFGTGTANGLRLTAGMGLMDGVTLELSAFVMLNRPGDFGASSNGNGTSSSIARPFFEPITGNEAAQLIAFPNRFAGSINVSSRATLWGVEGNFFEKFNLGIPVTLGVGFRYANLNDTLQIQQSTTALNAPPLTFNGNTIPLTDSIQIMDSFQAHNQFIGPQLNARYEHSFGRFSLEVLGKIALGSTQQTTIVAGQSNHLAANGQVLEALNGGFLATPTNIGTTTGNTFSVIPEVNVKLGYNVTQTLNVFVSYDFLAWTNVVRAADQIDRTVNLTQVPTAAVFNPAFGGPANPAPLFRTSDLFVHSFRVGLEWKF